MYYTLQQAAKPMLVSSCASISIIVMVVPAQVAPEGLTALAREAMVDISHLLRTSHLRQLRSILDDPEASANDKFVALELLKNANIAAGG